MTEKINMKELEAMVSNVVNELGINEVFNEEMNKKIQEKIKSKISSEKEVIKEEGIEEPTSDMPNLDNIPSGAQIMVPGSETPSLEKTPTIEPSTEEKPQLPSFIEKAEPAQVFVFDYNELSLGGENMANKAFRLMSDPDKKKSMHDMWIEEGKIRADVYMVKFEKLGEIKFNPWNTTANLEEKRFDPELNNIAQPFNENPNEPKVGEENKFISPGVPTREQDFSVSEVPNNELEAKIYDIVSKMIKGFTIHAATGPIGVNIDAISAGQVKNPEPEAEDTLKAITIEKKPEFPIMEENFKMLDLIKDNEFTKINTPEELKEGINGKPSKAILVSKNEEVQSWKFEGKTYYLPTNIISVNKCYINKKTL